MDTQFSPTLWIYMLDTTEILSIHCSQNMPIEWDAQGCFMVSLLNIRLSFQLFS